MLNLCLMQVCDAIANVQERPVWISEGAASNAHSFCSSDYFSLDTSQSLNSQVDLRGPQYGSQPCLARKF